MTITRPSKAQIHICLSTRDSYQRRTHFCWPGSRTWSLAGGTSYGQ